MAFELLVIFLGWSTPLPAGWYPWSNLVIEALGLLGSTLLGGLIASRRPENRLRADRPFPAIAVRVSAAHRTSRLERRSSSRLYFFVSG